MNKLKRWMKQRELSQADLARQFGISTAYLSFFLNGHRTFGAKTALRISRLTGIPMEELFR